MFDVIKAKGRSLTLILLYTEVTITIFKHLMLIKYYITICFLYFISLKDVNSSFFHIQ
jgi:hypothetical protein